MNAPRPSLAALFATLALVSPARAEEPPNPADSLNDATRPAAPRDDEDDDAAPRRPAARSDARDRRDRDDLKREVMDEVRRELDKTKSDIRAEVSYVEAEADARSYDAQQLKELKQTVNLLQLHGYFRTRGNLYTDLDLKRGGTPTLFPVSPGTSEVAFADMRLRLNPVLRISDGVAVYGQFDMLDNVLLGGNALVEPFSDGVGSGVLSTRTGGAPINVKRLWAEVEVPFGQVAFGRMPFHFGEGMVWNDGNCIDCDYGTTFDRVQFSFGPAFGGHLFTLAADSLFEGVSSAGVPSLTAGANYGQPVDLAQLDDAYRFSAQVTRTLPPGELKKRRDNGEWALQYGIVGAYRFQHSQAAASISGESPDLRKIDAQFGDVDLYAQALWRKLRLSTEWAGFFGSYASRPTPTGAAAGQSIDALQWAGIVRGQYAFLKQDSLLAGVDLGIASGDQAPGMGARPGRAGDGPQFACAATCSDASINNFRMNPDFRIDQLLWRNLFTTITDAWFVRGEVRFKPGGRASGGGEDEGFELVGSGVYSNAMYAASTPNGRASPLGLELDATVTYTSKDRFFAALVAGWLFPLSGLQNAAGDAESASAYRAVMGVNF